MNRMNTLERRYAQRLSLLKRAGKIQTYRFEAVRFRLADRCWYTPDFLVVLPNNAIECHETKGFMRDDAAIKWKAVADLYPFWRFFLVRWKGPKYGWDIQRYNGHHGINPEGGDVP